MISTNAVMRVSMQKQTIQGQMMAMPRKESKMDIKKLIVWCAILAGCLIFWTVLLTPKAHAYTLDQWADAIKTTEGNPNYGILSVKCDLRHECRQICKRTVLHAWRDYLSKSPLKTPQAVDFIRFLGNRYCPPSVDPIGNRNWIKNMEALLW